MSYVPTLGRTLDWAPRFDEASRLFSATVDLEPQKVRSYTWSCDTYLDQGTEGACVGFAWAHELISRPSLIRQTNAQARQIYGHAQRIDEWAGENYSGTSVLAGAKAVQFLLDARGKNLMPEYRWAFGVEDVFRTVGFRGPVVLGINWFEGMYEPDEAGFLHPTGRKVGGHAILANGTKIILKEGKRAFTLENVDREKSWLRVHNSWGVSWGELGEAKITFNEMDELLQQDGEAAIPVVRQDRT